MGEEAGSGWAGCGKGEGMGDNGRAEGMGCDRDGVGGGRGCDGAGEGGGEGCDGVGEGGGGRAAGGGRGERCDGDGVGDREERKCDGGGVEEDGGAGHRGHRGGSGSGPGTVEKAGAYGGPSVLGSRSRAAVEEVLRNIYVARAFTAHQLESLIVERLGPMAERIGPAFVGVLGLDALFLDGELAPYEARVMRARCLRSLRWLARERGLMAGATEGFRAGRFEGW